MELGCLNPAATVSPSSGASPLGGRREFFPGARCRDADPPSFPLPRTPGDAEAPERSPPLPGVPSPSLTSGAQRRLPEADGSRAPGSRCPRRSPRPRGVRGSRFPRRSPAASASGGPARSRHEPPPPRGLVLPYSPLSPSPSKTGEGEETGAAVK